MNQTVLMVTYNKLLAIILAIIFSAMYIFIVLSKN